MFANLTKSEIELLMPFIKMILVLRQQYMLNKAYEKGRSK